MCFYFSNKIKKWLGDKMSTYQMTVEKKVEIKNSLLGKCLSTSLCLSYQMANIGFLSSTNCVDYKQIERIENDVLQQKTGFRNLHKY